MKSLLRVLKSLLADAKRLLPETKGLERDLLTLEARFKNEGIGFLSVALPALGSAFDQGVLHGKLTCPSGFARKGSIPKLFSGMTCHVFDPHTGDYLVGASAEHFKMLRQICFLCKKFTPSEDLGESLDVQARLDFMKCDREIGSVAPFRIDHVSRVSRLVLEELDDFQELRCKHGPGAVAEGYRPNQKWSAMYSHLSDLDARMLPAGYDLVSYLHRDREELFLNSHNLPSDCARLVTVPKTCVALRTITVEPCLNQFVQQGLNDHLRMEINRCSVMSRILALSDQRPNQKLAMEGSITGEWATIDLSSASDRLSTVLVEAAFAHRPRYLAALLSVRTSLIDVGDEIPVPMKKFAGMGNATTFPVQSYVFALLALAYMTWPDKNPTRGKLKRLASNVRVFGDDIIIKTRYYSGFADWVESFGLKINRKKTFFKGDFRESCGVDAFKGVDVTPVYLRHDPDITSTDAEAFCSVLASCNLLWLQCMYATSDCLKDILDKRVRLPNCPNDSPGLGYHTRQNARTLTRWSSTLHRFEVRTLVQVPTRVPDRLDGMAALMKFFHSSLQREDERTWFYRKPASEPTIDKSHMESSVRRFSLNLRWRWVPSA